MKRSASWFVSGAIAVLGVAACAATPSEAPESQSVTAVVSAPAVTAPAAVPAPPPATAPAAAPTSLMAGQQILEAQCQTCHDLGMVTSILRLPGDWPELLQRMQGYGASLSRVDQAVLLDYLVKTHSTPG
jgi:cytochrome c5